MLVTLKLIQLLRKFISRHLQVSVINTVSLKEIEQLVFGQWTFEVFQVFLTYTTLSNCDIGQYEIKLHLQRGVNLVPYSAYQNVNRDT